MKVRLVSMFVIQGSTADGIMDVQRNQLGWIVEFEGVYFEVRTSYTVMGLNAAKPLEINKINSGEEIELHNEIMTYALQQAKEHGSWKHSPPDEPPSTLNKFLRIVPVFESEGPRPIVSRRRRH